MEKYFERHGRVAHPSLTSKIEELVELAGGGRSANAKLYGEMLRTVVGMIQEDTDRWDAKLANYALTDMAKAFAQLRPYKRRRKATVFGSARTKPGDPDYELAVELGRALVRHEYMVITGAGPGIMQAAHEGAGRACSVGLNISLPHEQGANPVIEGDPKLIDFRFFFTRKLFFVKEADAVILMPGGFGTQDESFELLTLMQTGKSPLVPVVLLDSPETGYWKGWESFVKEQLEGNGMISESDRHLFTHAHSVDEVIESIDRFFSNFHSTRWVGDSLRLRLLRPITEEALERINEEYGDLSPGVRIEQVAAAPEEDNESELADLPRIALNYHHRGAGRLRQLVAALNAADQA